MGSVIEHPQYSQGSLIDIIDGKIENKKGEDMLKIPLAENIQNEELQQNVLPQDLYNKLKKSFKKSLKKNPDNLQSTVAAEILISLYENGYKSNFVDLINSLNDKQKENLYQIIIKTISKIETEKSTVKSINGFDFNDIDQNILLLSPTYKTLREIDLKKAEERKKKSQQTETIKQKLKNKIKNYEEVQIPNLKKEYENQKIYFKEKINSNVKDEKIKNNILTYLEAEDFSNLKKEIEKIQDKEIKEGLTIEYFLLIKKKGELRHSRTNLTNLKETLKQYNSTNQKPDKIQYGEIHNFHWRLKIYTKPETIKGEITDTLTDKEDILRIAAILMGKDDPLPPIETKPKKTELIINKQNPKKQKSIK